MTDNASSWTHIPVLASETVAYAMPWESGERLVIDGTVGFGGHSSLILQKNPDARILGLDRDDCALAAASEKLAFASDRVRLVHSNFSNLAEQAEKVGWHKVDSILLDIGVSSPQIDNPERGFSFRFKGPLDMRMDRTGTLTAQTVLQTYSERDLTRIFREYGEIREAARLARVICAAREKKVFETVQDFADICEKILGHSDRRSKSSLPVPTLAFQAVRIEVNQELEELKTALESALRLLKKGGRLTVISFHSLEDRIVKHFFLEMAAKCKCPPGYPVCVCNWTPKLNILTKKPVTASEEELSTNPRAACAKLRSAERTEFEIESNIHHKTTNQGGRI